jgi:lysophospholipase L1-like esterase
MRRSWLKFAAFGSAGIAWIVLSSLGSSASLNDPGDPVRKPVIDTVQYNWLHEEFNMIQFYSKSALEHFRQSWIATKTRKMSIVHLGDSHLQSDIFPGRLRKNLQQLHGDGGRGLVFPYSAAKTYSSIEYKSEHTGEWTYGKALIIPPKLPLGVIGMSCYTADPKANFTLTFDDPVQANYTVLKVYVKKQRDSYDFEIHCGNEIKIVSVDSLASDTLAYIEIPVKPSGNELKLQVVKNNESETEFEFYGMSLETPGNSGMILHNCGVGGARYQSILYEELFQSQLPTLHPDLVIVDFGTNDYLYDDSIKTELPDEIRRVVATIRTAAPEASILLTSTMDMNRKGRNVRSGEKFSDLIHQMARELNCGVYDWFWIAGGNKAMTKWVESGLAQPDNIHLSLKGYRLKGDLLADAMVQTLVWMDKYPAMDSLVLFTDSIRVQQKRLALKDTLNKDEYAGRVMVKHKVRSGESLSVIGHKYGVTVADIKKWNNLKSNMIHPGQTLIIYKKKASK